MNTIIFVAMAIFVLILLSSVAKDADKIFDVKKKQQLSELKLSARRPLTPFEEKMYLTLTSALPECTVLAQVAFSSLITTNLRSNRNRFDRKVADFVICSKQLTPIAIIELDDASHDKKADLDADRDAMLQNVGYRTLRYKRIPSAEEIQADIEATLKNLTAN